LPKQSLKGIDNKTYVQRSIVDWKSLLALFEEKRILMKTIGAEWKDVWTNNGISELRKILNLAAVPDQDDLVGGWDSYSEGFSEDANPYIDRMVEQVSQTTANKMKKTIENGLNDGLPIKDIAEQISSSTAFNFKRARIIARTEATRVHNGSNLKSMSDAKSFGVSVKKAWLANSDNRTRESHIELMNDYGSKQNAIEPEELFVYGDLSAPNPGDWNDEEMDVNCRCVIKPIIFRGQ
jgi:hypothetical protein